MRSEHSAGAVIYDVDADAIVLLKHRDGHWEFPKGKLENGEEAVEAMRREVLEETGLTVQEVLSPLTTTHYTFWHNGTVKKRVEFFLVRAEGELRASSEHLDAEWVAIDEASERLRFENHHQVLRQALSALRPERS